MSSVICWRRRPDSGRADESALKLAKGKSRRAVSKRCRGQLWQDTPRRGAPLPRGDLQEEHVYGTGYRHHEIEVGLSAEDRESNPERDHLRQAPVESFDKFVETWKAGGGEQITKEVNEWYQSVK